MKVLQQILFLLLPSLSSAFSSPSSSSSSASGDVFFASEANLVNATADNHALRITITNATSCAVERLGSFDVWHNVGAVYDKASDVVRASNMNAVPNELHTLDTKGNVLSSVQLNPDPFKPGMIFITQNDGVLAYSTGKGITSVDAKTGATNLLVDFKDIGSKYLWFAPSTGYDSATNTIYQVVMPADKAKNVYHTLKTNTLTASESQALLSRGEVTRRGEKRRVGEGDDSGLELLVVDVSGAKISTVPLKGGPEQLNLGLFGTTYIPSSKALVGAFNSDAMGSSTTVVMVDVHTGEVIILPKSVEYNGAPAASFMTSSVTNTVYTMNNGGADLAHIESNLYGFDSKTGATLVNCSLSAQVQYTFVEDTVLFN